VANAETLTHIERLDDNGQPTGNALCDTGDGTFPGGLLAINSGRADCEDCIEWVDDADAPDLGATAVGGTES
jgi:hypothetical protein